MQPYQAQSLKLVLRNGHLRLVCGTLPTMMGPLNLPYCQKGLYFYVIPLLMGAPPTSTHQSTLKFLQKIHGAVCRLRPSFILALRIVLQFGIAKLDYVYEAMPPVPSQLSALQREVDVTALAALKLPKSMPKALLYAPLRARGFGVTHLATRLGLRYVLGFFKALNSRNALIKSSTRWLFLHPTPGVVDHDLFHLHRVLHEHHLQVLFPSFGTIAPAIDVFNILRQPLEKFGEVALFSDGSSRKNVLGWGALIAD